MNGGDELHAGKREREEKHVPDYEQFLLKDLDTGMKSYVTDQEWVEKPTTTTLPSATRSQHAHVHPHLPHPHIPKRARSDELQSSHASHMFLPASQHVKTSVHKKRDRDFGNLYTWQTIRAHKSAIRVLEFSKGGKFLASGGADMVIRLWEIDVKLEHARMENDKGNARDGYAYIKNGEPCVELKGHTSDVTALSWSKNDFLLSGSADRTIRLWHPRAKSCLRVMYHEDFVTCVAFHPYDEQICISGCADGRVRMWHLKEQKMLSVADTDDLVTACAITPDGSTALVGTYFGRCKFYGLFDEVQGEWQFKHTTQLDVRSRRAKHAQGKKICGFRFYGKTDKVIISSNDSRLRLFRLDDKSVLSKFQGHVNAQGHLNASFSPGGRYLLSASEGRAVFVWELDYALYASEGKTGMKEEGERRDGISYETFVVADGGNVTAACFAPRLVPKDALWLRAAFTNARTSGIVIVVANEEGGLRVLGCS